MIVCVHVLELLELYYVFNFYLEFVSFLSGCGGNTREISRNPLAKELSLG